MKNIATTMPMTGNIQCQWYNKNSITESSFYFILLAVAATAAASALNATVIPISTTIARTIKTIF
jgi:hypothetical protein